MSTTINDNNSGIYTHVADASVQTADFNKDGLVDAVRFENGTPEGLQANSDGWVLTTTQSDFEAVSQALQSMGLEIVNDGVAGEVLKNIGQELQLEFAKISKSVSGGMSSGLVLQSGSANNYADVQGQWADFISKTGLTGELDVNALVQQVLREAYVENTEDLRFYAQKVKYFNELKDQVRGQLTEARKLMSLQAGRDDLDPVTSVGWGELSGGSIPRNVEFDSTPEWNAAEGRYMPGDGEDRGALTALNKAELEAYITNTEEFLNSVGDDAQLANVDLQNMLQKQQQTLQMMSNISKMLHDTAMAIVRKIG
ncbi:MAG: hypothetical protein AAFY60_18765 [Myxococcota bacterium]